MGRWGYGLGVKLLSCLIVGRLVRLGDSWIWENENSKNEFSFSKSNFTFYSSFSANSNFQFLSRGFNYKSFRGGHILNCYLCRLLWVMFEPTRVEPQTLRLCSMGYLTLLYSETTLYLTVSSVEGFYRAVLSIEPSSVFKILNLMSIAKTWQQWIFFKKFKLSPLSFSVLTNQIMFLACISG